MADLVIDLVAADDSLSESVESFTVELAAPGSTTGADIDLGNASVTTVINDNDQAVWSIRGDTSVDEGSSAQYMVGLTGTLQAGETASIGLSLSDISTTSTDYASFVAAVNAAIVGRPELSFAGGVLTYTGDGNAMADLVLDLAASDDLLTEGPESFTVNLATPASTTGADIGLGNASVTTTLVDLDQSVWSITGDASVNEGDSA